MVTIDGTGTPGRSKAFQTHTTARWDATTPSRIRSPDELAANTCGSILSRAGIWGHSGGGFATTTALFRFPDFFKAGIAESGNHDQRENEDDWGERHQGLVEERRRHRQLRRGSQPERREEPEGPPAPRARGTMDTNVPPAQTMLCRRRADQGEQDFELVMIPNANHDGAASNYMMRRRWDFFVRWLMETEPPKNGQIK